MERRSDERDLPVMLSFYIPRAKNLLIGTFVVTFLLRFETCILLFFCGIGMCVMIYSKK
jgi:hypothetical protein